ncbi:MAG: hypothetical protein KDA68_04515 [Planctomycetaceae bacterium]|nr:hypothetical protein [Planctomycetaceae bacterium]
MSRKPSPKAPASEFSHIKLDGSCLHAAWSQFYTRLGRIIHDAIEQKKSGVGVFARPEMDVCLVGLIGQMHRLNPEAGWLELGLTTFAKTLQDALKRAPEIYWGRKWSEPIEGNFNRCFDQINASSLLKKKNPKTFFPSSFEFLITGMKGGVFDFAPNETPSKGEHHRRRRLYDNLNHCHTLVQQFYNRPDGSYPKVTLCKPPEFTGEQLTPLWENAKFPPMPQAGTAQLLRFGNILMSTADLLLDSTPFFLEYVPIYLGLNDLPELDEEEEQDKPQFPHFQFWSNVGVDYAKTGFLELAKLDRVFHAPSSELLEACLAKIRLSICDRRWHLPISFRPKTLDWNDALLASMVNDNYSQRAWVEAYSEKGSPHPMTNAQSMVQFSWLSEQAWPKKLKLPKKIPQFDQGLLQAMQGLAEGKAKLVNEGVANMLTGYPKTAGLYVPREWNPELCLPAIAVQRIALRTGLKLNVPDEAPNDPELVAAPDPTTPVCKWSAHPGIELVATYPEECEWPSLYLNQIVSTVEDTYPD